MADLMGAVLLGIVLTYGAAPLAAYLLIAPAYRLDEDKSFLTAVIALGFGPIGISFLLFLLFTVAPGHSSRFYVSCICLLIFLVPILRSRFFRNTMELVASLIRDPARRREIRNHPGLAIVWSRAKTSLGRIFGAAANSALIILGLILFINLLKDLTPSSILEFYKIYIYAAATAVVGLVIVAFPVLFRDVIAVAQGLLELICLPFRNQLSLTNTQATELGLSHYARLVAQFALTTAQAAKRRFPTAAKRGFSYFAGLAGDNFVVAFGAVLTAILLAMVIYAGLSQPLVENDPLEYAMVSRAIYAAKSLSVYPIFTGLPDSGLYAAAAHPPAFHLLEVWGYFFDGPNATRMLRLGPLFYFVNTILLMSALLARYNKFAPALGSLFVLSVPVLLYVAIASHIDPMRLYFFFLSLYLVADIIKHPNLPRVIVCAVAVGFALYTHLLGIITAFIGGSAYLLLAKTSWRERILNAAVIGVIASIIAGLQYVKNFVQFGSPVLDYQPVWLIPELHEAADLAQRRRIGTPLDIVVNGVIQNFTNLDLFGPIAALALVLILLRMRFLWRDDLTRVMLFACAAFYFLIGAFTLFGSLAAIKNFRYMMTIEPVLCFLAAVALSDIVAKWSAPTDSAAAPGSKRRWTIAEGVGLYFRSPCYILILMALTIMTSVPMIRGYISQSRASLVWQARDADFVYDKSFGFGPLVRYFFDRPPTDGKLVVFRQSDFAFYGRYPWIDHLDPVLLDFYLIKDKQTAYRDLIRRGISYFFVPYPSATPTAYYNSQAIEIASDPRLSEMVAFAHDAAVFRIHKYPEQILCTPVAPNKLVVENDLRERRNFAQRILGDGALGETSAELPSQRQEFSIEPGDLGGEASPITLDKARITGVELGGIDVSADAASQESVRGARRIHVALDLEGTGIVEISLESLVGNSSSASMLWSGLLEGYLRRINVQAMIPPRVDRLNLIIRKYNKSFGTLNVRGVHLCRFQGLPIVYAR